MSYTSVFLAEATKEVLDAWEWYEDKQPGLGDRFYKLVTQQVKKIEANPEYFTKRGRLYREARIEPFPYVIIFRTMPKERAVIIASVFHTSRKPTKKFK